MNQLKQTLCVFENQEYFGKKFQVKKKKKNKKKKKKKKKKKF